MSLRFIVIPLALMMLVGFVNMAKSGQELTTRPVTLDDANDLLEDVTHHDVCYPNGTVVSGGESGRLITTFTPSGQEYNWVNSTGSFFSGGYALHGSGSTGDRIDLSWFFSGSIGFLAIIAALMVVATMVGLRVLGSGISEMSISTIVKGLAYLSLFLAVASVSLVPIQGIPVFGTYIFIGLTFMYTLGMISQMGHVGGSD